MLVTGLAAPACAGTRLFIYPHHAIAGLELMGELTMNPARYPRILSLQFHVHPSSERAQEGQELKLNGTGAEQVRAACEILDH